MTIYTITAWPLGDPNRMMTATTPFKADGQILKAMYEAKGWHVTITSKEKAMT